MDLHGDVAEPEVVGQALLVRFGGERGGRDDDELRGVNAGADGPEVEVRDACVLVLDGARDSPAQLLRRLPVEQQCGRSRA